MIPRQCLVKAAHAVGVEVDVQPAVLKRLQPKVVAEVLVPAVQHTAQLPRAVQNVCKAAVAHREASLDAADSAVMIVEMRGLKP